MEAISRSCLPAAAARTKRQRKATCCGVLGAASHRTTCARSSTDKLTSGLILAMRTHRSYWPQYVYLFMIHTTSISSTLACLLRNLRGTAVMTGEILQPEPHWTSEQQQADRNKSSKAKAANPSSPRPLTCCCKR